MNRFRDRNHPNRIQPYFLPNLLPRRCSVTAASSVLSSVQSSAWLPRISAGKAKTGGWLVLWGKLTHPFTYYVISVGLSEWYSGPFDHTSLHSNALSTWAWRWWKAGVDTTVMVCCVLTRNTWQENLLSFKPSRLQPTQYTAALFLYYNGTYHHQAMDPWRI